MITETNTKVQDAEVDLDEFLGQPGADSIMIPGEESDKKANVFSNMTPDTSFLDKVEKTDDLKKDLQSRSNPTDPIVEKLTDDNIADILKISDDKENIVTEEKNKGGRPSGIISVTKKLIEKKIIVPFEDEKNIEDYTEEDFTELFEANINQAKELLEEELPERFFANMPDEMQQAYTYIANGGKDLKGLFRTLAASTEIRDLDISNENGQKYAIRTYLQATNYGTPEEIEDEINSLEDRDELAKKAKQFKPKLDAMQQQIVNQRLIEQQQTQKQRAAQSQKYIESVYNTLEKGQLGDLKIDNKTQNMLYAGLIQSNYPSMNGKQTNMLGHLLEKYQWVEPNHGLIAEALWLLADPDGYRKSLGNKVEKVVNAKTLRTLKTEEANKQSNAVDNFDDDQSTQKPTRTIPKPTKNFFGRA